MDDWVISSVLTFLKKVTCLVMCFLFVAVTWLPLTGITVYGLGLRGVLDIENRDRV